MPMYKCEVPGCNKYFSSQAKRRRHEQRVHIKGDANPNLSNTPDDDKPSIKAQELKIKAPSKNAKSEETQTYHCKECGAALKKGETPCPGCGEALSWEAV